MKDSPCATCKVKGCNMMCPKWKIWFSSEWRKVRRMFAKLGFEVEVKDDAAD